jgi:hypothetical protein
MKRLARLAASMQGAQELASTFGGLVDVTLETESNRLAIDAGHD